ncbi:MAG: hypothetical protein UV50_C0012G0014 [Parcubacteria group bacterium GW2011_GWB1_42_9]|nr:MAG: hypothetical protein UV50_C0012G0014 [Parcubacteria group bacterium GW2011_GWB1_42_9]
MTTSTKTFIWANLLVFSLFVLVPVLVSAMPEKSLIPCDGPKGIEQFTMSDGKAGVACQLILFWKLVGSIIRFVVFTLMPIVATVAILLAGIKIVTKPETIDARTEGKKLIGTVVLGMVIIFSAYLIMQAIINSLVDESTTIGQTMHAIFNQ